MGFMRGMLIRISAALGGFMIGLAVGQALFGVRWGGWLGLLLALVTVRLGERLGLVKTMREIRRVKDAPTRLGL